MALDASVGTSTSNSYLTEVEADAYFDNRLHGTSRWSALSDKEPALISMTNLLDWYCKFKGSQTSTTQALKWPRTGVILPDGTTLDDDIIPTNVKNAVCELVLSSISSDRTADSDLAGLSQATAGPLTLKTDGRGPHSTAKEVIPEHVTKMLSDLISGGGVSVKRLVRA